MKRFVFFSPLFRPVLLLLFMLSFSCSEKDPEPLINYPSLLMSKGWELDAEDRPYLNINGPRPILVESTEPLNDQGQTITSLFGDYESGLVNSIDAVYTSVSAGPNWIPPWSHWP
jgi:hypothetical protein